MQYTLPDVALKSINFERVNREVTEPVPPPAMPTLAVAPPEPPGGRAEPTPPLRLQDYPPKWLRDAGFVAAVLSDPASPPPAAADPLMAIAEAQDAQPDTEIESDRFVPFPVNVLPELLQRYVAHGVLSSSCNASSVALPLLTMLGTLIGNSRRLWIRSRFKVPAALWTAVVGSTGSRKTPAFDSALEPLWRLRQRTDGHYHRDLATHKQSIKNYKQSLADWKKNKQGDEPEEPLPPVRTRFEVNDCTLEGLLSVLAENPRGVLLYNDELDAWLSSFNAYRSGKGGDEAKYIQTFGGGSMSIDRKLTGYLFIRNVFVGITGGIQPSVLTESLATKKFVSNGMLARFLLAWPDPVKARWEDVDENHALEQEMDQLLQKVRALRGNVVEGQDEPLLVYLSRDAKPVWKRFFDEQEDGADQIEYEVYRGSYNKFVGYAARLALILHVVESQLAPMEIDGVQAGTLERAIHLTRWFAHETQRIYRVLGIGSDKPDVQRQELNKVLEFGRRTGVVTLRNATRMLHRSSVQALIYLKHLEREGYGTVEQVQRSGLPTVQLRLKPTA